MYNEDELNEIKNHMITEGKYNISGDINKKVKIKNDIENMIKSIVYEFINLEYNLKEFNNYKTEDDSLSYLINDLNKNDMKLYENLKSSNFIHLIENIGKLRNKFLHGIYVANILTKNDSIYNQNLKDLLIDLNIITKIVNWYKIEFNIKLINTKKDSIDINDINEKDINVDGFFGKKSNDIIYQILKEFKYEKLINR